MFFLFLSPCVHSSGHLLVTTCYNWLSYGAYTCYKWAYFSTNITGLTGITRATCFHQGWAASRLLLPGWDANVSTGQPTRAGRSDEAMFAADAAQCEGRSRRNQRAVKYGSVVGYICHVMCVKQCHKPPISPTWELYIITWVYRIAIYHLFMVMTGGWFIIVLPTLYPLVVKHGWKIP